MPENSKNTIDIDYLSHLARIEITPEEKMMYTQQIENILSFLKQLDTIDVSGIEATAHSFPVYNVWQEDIPGPTLPVDALLLNAPAAKKNQILVPKVIE